MTGSETGRPALAADWIEEVRSALAAAEEHPESDQGEFVAGYLVNYVCTRETAAERRGRPVIGSETERPEE